MRHIQYPCEYTFITNDRREVIEIVHDKDDIIEWAAFYEALSYGPTNQDPT